MSAPVRRIGLGALINRAMGNSLSRASEALGIPECDPWDTAKKVFVFHRRKDRERNEWGVEVWLWRCDPGTNVLRHGVNLSACDIAPFLRSQADAEEWAGKLGDEYGFVAMKRVRPKRKKPRPVLRVIDGGAP